jgi:outer membrane receptor for Fe3+-dicitrate
MNNRFLLSSISLASPALASQARAAMPQETPATPAVQETSGASAAGNQGSDAVQTEIQQVVVTGVATGGVRKLDSAFSITTASEEQLKQAAPSSTADILKLVPGVYAEATGGQSGANI